TTTTSRSTSSWQRALGSPYLDRSRQRLRVAITTETSGAAVIDPAAVRPSRLLALCRCVRRADRGSLHPPSHRTFERRAFLNASAARNPTHAGSQARDRPTSRCT